MESCFSCFTVKILNDFRVMTVARERNRLVPLMAVPMGRPIPLANAATKIPQVIKVEVIKPVSTIPVIVLNRFIFSCNPFTNFKFTKKKCLSFS